LFKKEKDGDFESDCSPKRILSPNKISRERSFGNIRHAELAIARIKISYKEKVDTTDNGLAAIFSAAHICAVHTGCLGNMAA